MDGTERLMEVRQTVLIRITKISLMEFTPGGVVGRPTGHIQS